MGDLLLILMRLLADFGIDIKGPSGISCFYFNPIESNATPAAHRCSS